MDWDNATAFDYTNGGYHGPKSYEAQPGVILRSSRSELVKMGFASNKSVGNGQRRRTPSGERAAPQTGKFVIVRPIWFGFSKNLVSSHSVHPFFGNSILNRFGWVMIAAMLFCVYKVIRIRRSPSLASE